MNAHEIKDVLANSTKLKTFAENKGITVEVAITLLNRLLEQPEVSENSKKYAESDERSDDFKGYKAGLESGKKEGHEQGFFKGVLCGFGLFAAVCAVVIANS